MRKEIQQESTQRLSLRFLSDGSFKVTKGSTTIHKIGTLAHVSGGLTKDFTGNCVGNINLVQRLLRVWMREYQEVYNSDFQLSVEGMELTSIKYKRLVLVQESLPQSVLKSPDALSPCSDSASLPSRVAPRVGSPPSPNQIRNYSSRAVDASVVEGKTFADWREKIDLSKHPNGVVVPFHLLESKVKLLRDETGAYKFTGIDSISLSDIRGLRKVLTLIKANLRHLDLKDAKGYVNSTRLSDVPILNKYLKAYVKVKERGTNFSKVDVSQDSLDKVLTQNEKRILVGWFSCLYNLNMYYLLLDVQYRLGVGQSKSKLCDLLALSPLSATEKVEVHDLILDIQSYAKKYYGGINASVREALRQRGLGIIENTYCGFDTEYKNVEMGQNQIISAQWAVNSQIILTLPHLTDYDLSGQNTLSGETYPINKMWFDQDKINFGDLQASLRGYIKAIRSMRFSENDENIKRITLGLKEAGLPYFISKGKINFRLERSPIKTYLKKSNLSKLDLSTLVRIGLNLDSGSILDSRKHLISLLNKLNTTTPLNEEDYSSVPLSNATNIVQSDGSSIETTDDSLESKTPPRYKGSSSRTFKGSFTSEPISVTTRRNFYIIGHLTQADLSLLSDFDEIKKDLDIVNRCMVTLGRSSVVKYGHNIIFRDTLLLAPGGQKSLAAIGSMYGEKLKKVDLSSTQYQNMDVLLQEDPELFKAYALRDSLISLVHAEILEDAHFRLNKLGIPLTLSSLGVSNLRHFWEKVGYKGYQISKDYLLGDSRKVPTPKGLFMLGNVGLYLNNYIASYKGGRNESFMIGLDTTSNWYDYDLTSAYTSAMAMLGDPNYDLARRISPKEIRSLTEFELLYSYTTVELKDFVFPDSVTYPSIPCYADEVTTTYPRSGKAVITGVEYLTALRQECKMEITGGTLIPFRLKDGLPKESLSDDARTAWRIGWDSYKSKAFAPLSVRGNPLGEVFKDMPFSSLINDLQSKRREHLRGTIQNLLYKEMGNSLYGSVTKGINHKVKFDIKTNRPVRMEANDISNPIIASWITAYVRSLLGEMLHKIDTSGGKVVSVTTDGFITDVPGLEPLLLDGIEASEFSLIKEYRSIRDLLSGDPTCLEIKNEKRGCTNLMSWTVRGQLSVDMGIKAMTGLQTSRDLQESWSLMSSGGLGKTISFISSSLRSAKDIYKKGGHVTMGYRDQDFRKSYNNCRVVIEDPANPDGSKGFLSTRPVKNVEEALTLRKYSQLNRSAIYSQTTGVKTINKYTSNLELGIRSFLKSVLSGHDGLSMSSFSGYQDLIAFVHKYVFSSGYKLKRSIDSSYISQIKLRQQDKVNKPYGVPRLPCIMAFYDYVKERFPSFDASLILQKV